MADKRYTVEEANALLPHLAPALVELRDKFEQAATIKLEIARAGATNGWSSERDHWSRTLARVAELVERLQGWGIEVRDLSSGLIDFPTTMEGRDAYLCWRLGEEDVAYWHFPDDGFAGRKPL